MTRNSSSAKFKSFMRNSTTGLVTAGNLNNTNHEDGIPSIFSSRSLDAEASNRQADGAHFPHLLDAPSFE